MNRALKTTSLPAGLIALTLFAALLAPTSALASWEDLLQQACGTKGQVTGTFTQAEYKEALANIPADADQYSNCRSIIEAAQLAAAADSDAISEAQAATILAAATPAEQQAIARAVTESSEGTEAKVGDVIVDPAAFGTAATATATLNKLPLSLKVLLVLLGLGSLTALGAVLIPRVRNYYRSR
ncbi:MAG: hypothetical protein NWS55_07700 [Solirubrobacteraceae bacterium]|nr:hypothetical protein [Solirubrobacteraceae bacterium]